MKELFAELPIIGELYFHHIYLFNDEPQIFSCISQSKQLFFGIAIPCESEFNSRWLLLHISYNRLNDAENNKIEIRELIINPEGVLWQLECDVDEFQISNINSYSLTDDLLPEPNEFLDCAANLGYNTSTKK